MRFQYPYQTITITDNQPVFILTLNRPDVHNALSFIMLTEILEALDELALIQDLRLLIIRANGPSFCAGADLNELKNLGNEMKAHQFAQLLHDVLATLDSFPVPVISVIHGKVMGGGLGFLSVSDIVLAVGTPDLVFSELKIGMVPAVIAPYVIRRIGIARSRKFMLLASPVSLKEALLCGLISEEGTEEKINQRLEDITSQILSNAPMATRECKILLSHVSKNLWLWSIKEYTTQTFTKVVTGTEAKEKIEKFLQTTKRKGKKSAKK